MNSCYGNPRCEAGAYYRDGKLRYVCDAPADYQLILDNDVLLLVWCAAHATEHADAFMAGHPKLRLELLSRP